MAEGSETTHTHHGLPRWVLLTAFALSGAAALSYEVVWTRALSVVLGSTNHALSTMLATFMAGLAIGGYVGGRVADRVQQPLLPLGLAELGIGLLGVLSHFIIGALPAVYLAAYRAFHLSAPAYFATQVLLCAAVMLGPTILMGMTFPLVSKAAVHRVEDVGRSVGLAYAANTIGSVLGAALAGFVLIPGLGLRGTTFVAAAANAVAAAAVLLPGRRRRRALVAAALLLPAAWGTLRSDAFSCVVNFYNAHLYAGSESYATADRLRRTGMTLLSEREGRGGYVAAYRDRGGNLVIQVGGKVEGAGDQDRANMQLAAWLPIAAHPDPRSALVIGLGSGVTLEAARRSVADVDLVEINRDVIAAVAAHGKPALLDGVDVHVTDARNLLLRTEGRWDVISSMPSYPTDFAVANLFTREFYETAAARLAAGGVYCQWLPYYALTNDDVTMMVKTFAAVFPHATLWKVEHSLDLLLVGSLSPGMAPPEAIKAKIAEISGGEWLNYSLSRDAAQVAEIGALEGVPTNTDDRPRLEYAVARNLRVGSLALLEVEALRRAGMDAPSALVSE